jgi:hypothetical protein
MFVLVPNVTAATINGQASLAIAEVMLELHRAH